MSDCETPSPENMSSVESLAREMLFLQSRIDNTPTPRMALLQDQGLEKMTRKLVEEAMEVAVEALQERPEGVIGEGVDLLFNFLMLLHQQNLSLEVLTKEMTRRREKIGAAEKLPKPEPVAKKIKRRRQAAQRRAMSGRFKRRRTCKFRRH